MFRKLRHCGMGTYAHCIQIVPPWKDAKEGCRAIVGVDKCIAPLVIELWNVGIKTEESCCGHGIVEGYIATDKASVSIMEKLKFEHDERAGDPETTFVLPKRY